MRKKSEVGERLSHEIKLRKSHTSLASDSRISNEQKDTTPHVTFGLNVRLDLSGKATTKSLSSLDTELLFKILGKSARAVTVRVIRGDEGVGDIPGVRGGFRGVSEVLLNIARLAQELRLRV